MEHLAVERSLWINAAPERAWQAVTDPAQLTQWYATCCTWEIPALVVGAAVKFYNTPNEPLFATIETLDPPREFAVRWQADADTGGELFTRFLIAPKGDGVLVTIHESGYETWPAEDRQTMLDQTGAGYGMSLENLQALIDGRPLPH